MRRHPARSDYHSLYRTSARPLRRSRSARRNVGHRRKYSRAEKIGWLVNGFIWTIAIWTVLFLLVLHESETLRLRMSGLAPPAVVQNTTRSTPISLPDPTAVPLATPTATRVVTTAQSLPVAPVPTEPVVSSISTPAPAPTAITAVVEPPAEGPAVDSHSSSEPVSSGEPIVEPTVSAGGPAVSYAEAVPASLNQPPRAQPDPDGEPSLPASPPLLPTPAPVQQTGLPTRLVIDSINLDTAVTPVGWRTIFNGSQYENVWNVAEYAVGWHQNSARPGEAGNTVLTAHSNVKGEVFRYLADVDQGSIIKVYVDGTPREYKIDLTTIVKEAGEPLEVRLRNAQWIAPTTDERLTLVTCWPYPHSTHRFIVVAKPVAG